MGFLPVILMGDNHCSILLLFVDFFVTKCYRVPGTVLRDDVEALTWQHSMHA